MAIVALITCSAGAAAAQQQGGGQLPPPVFDPVLVFPVDAGGPYGLATADILDAAGNAGQDGYPEIAVAGAGVLLLSEFTLCDEAPTDRYVKIFHNKGADPNFAWDGPNAASALAEAQSLDIDNADPDMWATELAFADVNGLSGQDLVLVGRDPDNPHSDFGFLVVFENLGNGTFDPVPQTWTTTVPLRALVTADFDLDGDIDVAAAAADSPMCGEQDLVVVFQNTTAENFGVFGFSMLPLVDLNVPGGFAPGDIVTADFAALAPGQPLLDFVTPNPNHSSVTQATNLGSLVFSPSTVSSGCGLSWKYVCAASAKFGADLSWDFAAVNTVDPDFLLLDTFLGQGDGSFQTVCDDAGQRYKLFPQTAPTPKLHAHGVASGSIDNGPYPDLAVAMWKDNIFAEDPEWNGAVGVLLGKADGSFQTPSAQQAYIFRTDDPLSEWGVSISVKVEVVDLDADGFDDIVVANQGSDWNHEGTISVLINALELAPIGP